MTTQNQTRRAFLAACASPILAGCSETLAGGNANPPIECSSSEYTWPMYGYSPARTNNIGLDLRESNLPQTGTEKYQLSQTGTGPGGSVDAPPVVDDDVAYIAGSVRAEARNIKTGERLWAIELSDSITVSPVIACDTVYICAANETLAVDCDDGSELWSTNVGSPNFFSGSPIVSDETLYTVGQDITALEAKTGDERWTIQTNYNPNGIAVKNKLYITTADDNKSELIATTCTGDTRWRTDALGKVYAAPTVAGNTVYAVSQTGKLSALATDDGSIRWQADIEHGVSDHPAVANGHVVVGAGNGERTMAFNATTGDQLWTFETGISTGAPVITDKYVLTTGANTGIHMLDISTGERVRHWALTNVASHPIVTQDSLLYRDGALSEIFLVG